MNSNAVSSPAYTLDSAQKFYEPGEEPLAGGYGRRRGGDERLPKKFAVIVTDRRLLIVTIGGWLNEARDLVMEFPVSDVDSMEYHRPPFRQHYVMRVRGTEYTFSCHYYDLGEAVERAKAGTA